MKYLLAALSILFFSSCSDSFINHELKAEKIGDCTQQVAPVKMISNINGERYEFDYCLNEGFDSKNYTLERKGDSLVVSFPNPGDKTALYKLILDIDAKPSYHHIVLGDKTLEVSPAER